MTITIDAAGRVVIPKPIRDELGLAAGTPLRVRARDGVVELTRIGSPVQLERRGAALVAVAGESVERMTAEEVRDLVERLRR
jgi:AbrB family looped-hinge helix DNA binding protein